MPGLKDDRQGEYLHDAITQLVGFVVDGVTKPRRRALAQSFQLALVRYLEDRDIDVAAPSKHIFGILVDQKNRSVRRRGHGDKVVDLQKSAVGWHIFLTALNTAPQQVTVKAMKDGYPGSWDARASAVRDLSRRLKPLGLRINNRTLIALKEV